MQARALTPDVVTACVAWVRDFILVHHQRHPETLAEADLGRFRTHLAVERGQRLPRQAQARQALLLLYQEFLRRPLGPIPVQYAPTPGPSAVPPKATPVLAAPQGVPAPGRVPRPLLEQARDVLRSRHYSLRTEAC